MYEYLILVVIGMREVRTQNWVAVKELKLSYSNYLGKYINY